MVTPLQTASNARNSAKACPIDAKFLSSVERDETFRTGPPPASWAPGGPRYSEPEAKNANISAKTRRIRRPPGSFEPSRRTEQADTSFVIFGAVFAEILAENRRALSKMAPADDVTISGENRPYLGNPKTQRAQTRVRRSHGGPCSNQGGGGPRGRPLPVRRSLGPPTLNGRNSGTRASWTSGVGSFERPRPALRSIRVWATLSEGFSRYKPKKPRL
jgi:hypothetical protein